MGLILAGLLGILAALLMTAYIRHDRTAPDHWSRRRRSKLRRRLRKLRATARRLSTDPGRTGTRNHRTG